MLKVYFGDKNDPFRSGKYEDSREAFDSLREKLGAESLAFLNQVHGTAGACVFCKPLVPLNLFRQTGDYLITNEPGCAIGVLTADCLPIVLHDEKNNACAVIHAGWRGSVAGITGKALAAMKENFGTRAIDVVANFGPSAKVCCYEVGEDFAKRIKSVLTTYARSVLVQISRSSRVICEANRIEGSSHRGDCVFFDNVRLNELQLLEAGVLVSNIKKTENNCTICDNSYYSYRRDGDDAGRQATVVLVSPKG